MTINAFGDDGWCGDGHGHGNGYRCGNGSGAGNYYKNEYMLENVYGNGKGKQQ